MFSNNDVYLNISLRTLFYEEEFGKFIGDNIKIHTIKKIRQSDCYKIVYSVFIIKWEKRRKIMMSSDITSAIIHYIRNKKIEMIWI